MEDVSFRCAIIAILALKIFALDANCCNCRCCCRKRFILRTASSLGVVVVEALNLGESTKEAGNSLLTSLATTTFHCFRDGWKSILYHQYCFYCCSVYTTINIVLLRFKYFTGIKSLHKCYSSILFLCFFNAFFIDLIFFWYYRHLRCPLGVPFLFECLLIQMLIRSGYVCLLLL